MIFFCVILINLQVFKNEISEYGINVPTYSMDISQGNRHVKWAKTNRCIDYVIRLLVPYSVVNNVHCIQALADHFLVTRKKQIRMLCKVSNKSLDRKFFSDPPIIKKVKNYIIIKLSVVGYLAFIEQVIIAMWFTTGTPE